MDQPEHVNVGRLAVAIIGIILIIGITITGGMTLPGFFFLIALTWFVSLFF